MTEVQSQPNNDRLLSSLRTLQNAYEKKALPGTARMYGEAADEIEALKARITELEAALLQTRSLVSEAALTGFNWKDGDWTNRLFANQAKITAALNPKAGS
jgi:hypothetical protein